MRLGYEWFEVQVFPWFGSSFFLFNRNTLNNRSKIFLVFLKMVATVYERENCASNPGHLGVCRSITFAPRKNTEKKKPRIERTTEILRFENVFEREKAQFI